MAQETSDIAWLPVETIFDDEFGTVDPEVYEAAGHLWQQAQRFSERTLGDAHTGFELMLKAVAIVSRVKAKDPDKIKNLSAYLSQTFKRLILKKLEVENKHRLCEDELRNELETQHDHSVENLEKKILYQLVMRKADDWFRQVQEHLNLGYTFDNLAPKFGSNGNVIKSKYHKQLKKIKAQIQSEINEAKEKW